MDDTLEKALAALFTGLGSRQPEETASGTVEPPASGPPSAGSIPPQIRSLIDQAGQQYDTARQKLKQEDLGGYAEQMKAFQQTLNALRKAAHK